MMSHFDNQFIELEKSISETVQQARQRMRINARTQELLRVNGKAFNYCPEKAREQATLDVLGALAN